ncbi:MAG: site-specific DNA-methyltransferase [Bacteroidetes bacterium]|nr:site-specific DNA-methyltransferase [Bacteroidota bacterium]
MAKTYTGSLSLDWYNKQFSVLLQKEGDTIHSENDIPAPKMNWVNKDDALFYEIIDDEGRGLEPFWVNSNDIRIKEARPLILQKVFKAVSKDKQGTIPGTEQVLQIEESKKEDATVENILIKGDNLLGLNALKKIFANKPEAERIKCAYLDVPYNTGSAFEHYDDNLGHSEWLTLIRDRFILIKQLMRSDGFVFVQIDNKEVFRLKVLLDEIFGQENFINDIVWKRRGGSANPNNRLNNVTDYILWYSITPGTEFNQIYSLDDENTQEYIAERFTNELKGKKYMLAPIERNAKLGMRETLRYEYKGYTPEYGWMMSKENLIKMDKTDRLHWNNKGRPNRRVFLDDYQGQPISNLWTDIKVINPMSKERSEFEGGQKPEAIIERILTFGSNEGDFVLDVFGGSGTTFATAHKMKRKWVGVEIGKHADTLIIPRLKKVLSGSDDSGITKNQKWQGGGSFKYYHLGDSIIKIDLSKGTGDFNWSLGKRFIEESFLLSYDYIIDNTINLSADKLFSETEKQPVIGVQQIGSKNRVAIVTLNEPKGKLGNITYDELQTLYKTVKKKYSPEYINIFTNRGIEIAYDSKPEDLEVIKVPSAIFAELEK